MGMREQFADAPIAIGMPWRILIFSFMIFALAVFVAAGLHFGYARYLDGKITNADSRIQSLAASVEQRQQEFVTFYSQVVNLKTIFEKRSFTANTFSFLERNVIAPVYFTQAEMNVLKRQVTLQGFAGSLGDLSQQIAILERDAKNVLDVILDDVELAGGGARFSFTIVFSPEFLKNPLAAS